MAEILKNYVAGKWAVSASGKTFENENPEAFAGEVVIKLESNHKHHVRTQ